MGVLLSGHAAKDVLRLAEHLCTPPSQLLHWKDSQILARCEVEMFSPLASSQSCRPNPCHWEAGWMSPEPEPLVTYPHNTKLRYSIAWQQKWSRSAQAVEHKPCKPQCRPRRVKSFPSADGCSVDWQLQMVPMLRQSRQWD